VGGPNFPLKGSQAWLLLAPPGFSADRPVEPACQMLLPERSSSFDPLSLSSAGAWFSIVDHGPHLSGCIFLKGNPARGARRSQAEPLAPLDPLSIVNHGPHLSGWILFFSLREVRTPPPGRPGNQGTSREPREELEGRPGGPGRGKRARVDHLSGWIYFFLKGTRGDPGGARRSQEAPSSWLDFLF
jgi:hypothetical protein